MKMKKLKYIAVFIACSSIANVWAATSAWVEVAQFGGDAHYKCCHLISKKSIYGWVKVSANTTKCEQSDEDFQFDDKCIKGTGVFDIRDLSIRNTTLNDVIGYNTYGIN
jgi:hypothetical protein